MKPRERVLQALHIKAPDRVPFVELRIDDEIQHHFLGKKDIDIGDLLRTMSLDGWGVDYYPPFVARREYAGTQDYVVQGILRTRDDLDQLAFPKLTGSFFDEGKALLDEYGDEYAIFARTRLGPSFVLLSMGFDGFSYALHDDPGLIVEILKRHTDWAMELHDRLCAMGFTFIWACDDLAFRTAPFFSPEVFRELFLPWMKPIVDRISLPWVFHSDGNLTPLLEDLLSLGPNGLHPIEPGAMDANQVKRDYGHRLCIIGNIDLHYTLTRGTVDETIEEVRDRLANLAPGGGYILSSANSITKYCRPENIRAMIETLREYGKYPIRLVDTPTV
jgi:uroporphyrinogen decarboxylase